MKGDNLFIVILLFVILQEITSDPMLLTYIPWVVIILSLLLLLHAVLEGVNWWFRWKIRKLEKQIKMEAIQREDK